MEAFPVELCARKPNTQYAFGKVGLVGAERFELLLHARFGRIGSPIAKRFRA